MTMIVAGAASPRWQDREWRTIRTAGEDGRGLSALADPVVQRRSINPYDAVLDALRTSALKRDAALAGTSATASATAVAENHALATSPRTASAATETATLGYAPMTSSQYGEAYLRNAIAAYERSSDTLD